MKPVLQDSKNLSLIPLLPPVAALLVLLDWMKKGFLPLVTCPQMLTPVELVFQDSINLYLIPLLHPVAALLVLLDWMKKGFLPLVT